MIHINGTKSRVRGWAYGGVPEVAELMGQISGPANDLAGSLDVVQAASGPTRDVPAPTTEAVR
jgi:hypothetical protein